MNSTIRLPEQTETLRQKYKLGSNEKIQVGPQVMTVTQALVTSLIALGLSEKLAAQVMGISPKTISKHSYQIKLRIHVRTNVAMTHFAIEHHLIKPGEFCTQ